jgi:hypothetical protein
MVKQLTTKEFEYIKNVYENIIMTLVYKPDEIKLAYKMLYGIDEEEVINFTNAKRQLFNAFTHGNINNIEIIDNEDDDILDIDEDSENNIIKIEEDASESKHSEFQQNNKKAGRKKGFVVNKQKG